MGGTRSPGCREELFSLVGFVDQLKDGKLSIHIPSRSMWRLREGMVSDYIGILCKPTIVSAEMIYCITASSLAH